MKKQLLIIFAAVLLGFAAQAQDGDQLVYQKGDNLINAGIGFGYYGYGLAGSRSNSIPALLGNFEIGIHDYFGVGPYVGYKSWNYDFGSSRYGFNILAAGVRGSFHYSSLINEALDLDINDQKLDLYVVLNIGLEFQNYTGDYSGFNSNNNSTFFRFRPVLGARYYFNNKFAVFAEGGNGALSYFTLGLTIKL